MPEITVDALILTNFGNLVFRNKRKWAAYLFACDCLERALPFYERKFPGDLRPRQTIERIRRHADKHLFPKETRNAVRTVSNSIASAMGWSKGWAEKNPSAATIAWEAAHVSEWAVANAAMSPQDQYLPGIALVCDDEEEETDETFGVIKSEEVEWQTERLKHYLNI